MKALPKELMSKPNGYRVLLDRSNVTHRLEPGSKFRTACGTTGSPATLAQAILYGRAWCSHVECFTLGHVRGGS